jgi:UDP-sugar pyrophosphorylase
MGKKAKNRSRNKKKGTSTNDSNAKTSEGIEPPVVVESNETVPTVVVEETNGHTTPATNENAQEPTVVDDSKPEPKKSHVPEAVEKSLSLFSIPQQILIKLLCSPILNQTHLFDSWADPNTTDEMKKQLVSQLDDLNSSYPGSLAAYISNARKLLEDSKKGVNPLEGWKPTVPTGQAFEIGTKEYATVEAVGLKELGSVGFVLVAGGLGERLGYSDIKVRFDKEVFS